MQTVIKCNFGQQGGFAMNEQNNTPNESNEASTSSILSRSAQMLQAASPYLDENTKQTLESVVHVTDFLDTIQNFRKNGFSSMFSGLFGRRTAEGDTVSMANLAQSVSPLDTESILKSIRPFCTQKEGELIDRIMNIFSIQKFFSMYQTMQSMMSMMNMSNNPSQQNSDFTSAEQPESKNSSDDTSFYDTYWSNYYNNSDQNTNSEGYSHGDNSDISNAESNYGFSNSNTSYEEDSTNPSNIYDEHNFNPKSDYDENYNANNNFYENNFNSNTNYNENNVNSNANNNESNFNFNNTYNENDSISSNNEYNSMDNSSNRDTTASNTSAFHNMQMLDMLSSIIPPEQKSTFDTMKLLIESGMLK